MALNDFTVFNNKISKNENSPSRYNHPLITEQLLAKVLFWKKILLSYDEVLQKINQYDGIIIRSRIPLDKIFLENAQNLKFIAE